MRNPQCGIAEVSTTTFGQSEVAMQSCCPDWLSIPQPAPSTPLSPPSAVPPSAAEVVLPPPWESCSMPQPKARRVTTVMTGAVSEAIRIPATLSDPAGAGQLPDARAGFSVIE